jgi:hypothetical protein
MNIQKVFDKLGLTHKIRMTFPPTVEVFANYSREICYVVVSDRSMFMVASPHFDGIPDAFIEVHDIDGEELAEKFLTLCIEAAKVKYESSSH